MSEYVYVVIESQELSDGDSEEIVGVYKNYEDAHKAEMEDGEKHPAFFYYVSEWEVK